MTAFRRPTLALAAAAVIAGAVTLSGCGVASPGTPAAPSKAAPAVSGGHRGGVVVVPASRGGGGRVALPVSWPVSVPVPAGTIQATAARPGVWLLTITARGSIAQVRAAVTRLYTTHGFAPVPQRTTLVLLQNRSYRVSAFLYAHDHSPTATDMRLEVDRRAATTA